MRSSNPHDEELLAEEVICHPATKNHTSCFGSMADARTTLRLAWIGIPVVLLVSLVMFWNWDWLIPMVQSRASAAIGRPVAIMHLHVRPGRITEVVADGVVIANPPNWPSGDPPLASIDTLALQADVWGYLQGRGLVIPLIALGRPRLYAAETPDGTPNFELSTGSSGGPAPKLGELKISDGDAHVVIPKLKADFKAQIATQEQGDEARIVVDAKGTYAAQPIEAHLLGGALLSLRDADRPWPIDLTLANGPTRVTLKGTLQDPIALKGADIDLRFSGPDMGLLEPLVGIPIPKTPAYQVTGKLDFAGYERIKFQDVRGRLGNSDIGGSIQMQPGATPTAGDQAGKKTKPVVTLDLRSKRVDLADLSGFIGGEPEPANGVKAAPQQRGQVVQPDASDKLLPDKPISVSRLDWADIHLHYRGGHIEGRNMPLDDLAATLDIMNGRIELHPISFGVGKGRLLGNVELTPVSSGPGHGRDVHAKMDLHLQNLDVSRMMAATHAFEGAGSISGVGAIDATGHSVRSLLANGDGGVKMAMSGGDLSAVLVDLTGLHFGKALLSALGMPDKTPVQCFVGDLGLKRGTLEFNAFVVDTGEAIVNVGGNVDLASEKIDLNLKTDSKGFSVGSLPTRINITGTFKNPSIRPGAEVAARAGAAAGLAALFAPLAILPTVQFGTSEAEDARCSKLFEEARAQAASKSPPASAPSSGPPARR
jgi:uncharacterized protein involved in outer membrane biogenesis